jgi:Lon protease-like protein
LRAYNLDAVSELLPLFPLDLVLFPDTPLPLHIFEPRYREMIGECLRTKEEFGVIRVVPGAEAARLSEFGCTAAVMDVLRNYPDGRMDILTAGRKRFELLEVNDDRAFLRGRVRFFDDDDDASADLQPLRTRTLELHSELALLTDAESPHIDADSERMAFQLTSLLPVDLDFKQTVLEMRSESERLQTLLDYYSKIVPKLKTMIAGRKRAGGNGYVN